MSRSIVFYGSTRLGILLAVSIYHSGYIQRLGAAVNTTGTETNGLLSMYRIERSTASCFKTYFIERSLYVANYILYPIY